MPTAVYTGNYVDCGLSALAAYYPKLQFILTAQGNRDLDGAYSTDGHLLSTRPVEVTPAAGTGAFTVQLVPNDLIKGNTFYRVRATYLGGAGEFTSIDLFDFYARTAGGPVADGVVTGITPPLIYWQPDEPDPWPVGSIWVNSVTDDVRRRVT